MLLLARTTCLVLVIRDIVARLQGSINWLDVKCHASFFDVIPKIETIGGDIDKSLEYFPTPKRLEAEKRVGLARPSESHM